MSLKEYSKKSKKVIASCLAAAMCFSTGMVANINAGTVEAAAKMYGDFNGNDKVDLQDASASLRMALGIDDVSDEQLKLGDIDGDKKISLKDVTRILKASLGIEELPKMEETDAPTPTPTFSIPEKPTGPAIVITQTPVPTSIPLPIVTPGMAVTGTSIDCVTTSALNGAEYDAETGIYKFTDANKTAKRGIQFTNPWAGRTDLRQTVEEALPMFMTDASGQLVGAIKGDKLVSLDGKTVMGDIEDKEEYIQVTLNKASETTSEAVTATSEAVTTTSEAVTLDAVTADAVSTDAAEVITGKAVKWSESFIPTVNNIDGKTNYLEDYAELYAKPQWTNGVSISFWCKYDWAVKGQSDAAPMLVIKNSEGCDHGSDGEFAKAGHTGDFAVMLRLNGSVSLEGDESGNCFKADNCVAGNDGEWNYYTVTFANDWITVYVNGQELVYNDLVIDKDEICYFNNGFMTRYSPVYQIPKSAVNDIRNYLDYGFTSKTGEALDTLDKECCVIGNSRYANPDAVIKKKNSDLPFDLVVDLLTKETTEIWFGSSSDTQCVCLTSEKRTGTTAYKLQTGTQLAAVNCYDKELTPAEVSANYEVEYEALTSKLQLKEK